MARKTAQMEEHLGQLDLQNQPDLQESLLGPQPQSLLYLMYMIFASLTRIGRFAHQGTLDQSTHFAAKIHGCAHQGTLDQRTHFAAKIHRCAMDCHGHDF